jgi:hypothetical protein
VSGRGAGIELRGGKFIARLEQSSVVGQLAHSRIAVRPARRCVTARPVIISVLNSPITVRTRARRSDASLG